MEFVENIKNGIDEKQIEEVIFNSLKKYFNLKKILIIHSDYTRVDFTNIIVKYLLKFFYKEDCRISFLNASGTHRSMSEEEFKQKLGIAKITKTINFINHDFDNLDVLTTIGEIPTSFIKEKTEGLYTKSIPVTINRNILNEYDLIITITGTIPHEAAGYSGGCKIFFPGISGHNVIELFHWVAALIGTEKIIGVINNPAREIINMGSEFVFKEVVCPIFSFNMLYEELKLKIKPKGLYIGDGFKSFLDCYEKAAKASSKIHIKRVINGPIEVAVQVIQKCFDEGWTAIGKSSSRLQRPGVMKDGSEIIIYGPHINCFHSNKEMDEDIRGVGYHCKDYIVNYCRLNPDYDKNVAGHVITVIGPGSYNFKTKKEKTKLKITLATSIPREECSKVGLGYRNPDEIKEKDFQGPGKLWIKEGAKYLYER